MSREAHSEQPPTKIERILVALDTSSQSLNALAAAADLASLLNAELLGLFIEDDNLLRLGSLPFVREIGSYSASVRPLDGRAVEREFKQQANRLRRAMAQVAVSTKLRWSFQVARGNVSEELLTAAESAGLVTLGRVGRFPGKRYGSTAQAVVRRSMRPVFLLGEGGPTYPITLLHTGTPASVRAFRLANLLAQHRGDELRLLFTAKSGLTEPDRTRLIDSARAEGIDVQPRVIDAAEIPLNVLRAVDAGLLILPADQADILDVLGRSAILVP